MHGKAHTHPIMPSILLETDMETKGYWNQYLQVTQGSLKAYQGFLSTKMSNNEQSSQ